MSDGGASTSTSSIQQVKSSSNLLFIDLTSSDEEDEHHRASGLTNSFREDRKQCSSKKDKLTQNYLPSSGDFTCNSETNCTGTSANSNTSLASASLQMDQPAIMTTHNPYYNPNCRYGYLPPSDNLQSNRSLCPELSNNGEACSYSNCFVASSSNGVPAPAPITGPCPHNHGFCPIGNPHTMPTLPRQPSDFRNLFTTNLPSTLPPQSVPGQMQGHSIYNPFYTGQAPPHPSHGHNYATYQLPPGMNPSHQRILLSHHRIGEQQRRHLFQHQHRFVRQRLVLF